MKTIVLENMPELFWQTINQNSWNKYFFEKNCLELNEIEIVIIRTYVIFNKSHFEQFPNLKMIIRAGTGFDNIDFEEARKRNVIICNTPEANTISAYEHTLSLILAILKNINKGKQNILQNKWKTGLPSNVEFNDIRALIVGTGRVGKRVAKALQFLGAEVKCVDPYLDNDFWAKNDLESIAYEKGLHWCNLLTFHCPLTNETKNYFSLADLKKISTPIYLVNTARGKIVQEEAIERGLQENLLIGIGLDVFAKEPFEPQKWCEQENVFITPHTGSYTESAKKRISLETLKVWSEFVFQQNIIAQIDERFVYCRFD